MLVTLLQHGKDQVKRFKVPAPESQKYKGSRDFNYMV